MNNSFRAPIIEFHIRFNLIWHKRCFLILVWIKANRGEEKEYIHINGGKSMRRSSSLVAVSSGLLYRMERARIRLQKKYVHPKGVSVEETMRSVIGCGAGSTNLLAAHEDMATRS